MAKTPKKKSGSVGNNPDGRKNGKAWKKNKNKPAPPKTEARLLRDFQIQREREARRAAGMARRAEELRLAEELRIEREAEMHRLIEANKAEEAEKAARQEQKKRFNKALRDATVIDVDLSNEMDRAHIEGYFEEARAFVRNVMPVM